MSAFLMGIMRKFRTQNFIENTKSEFQQYSSSPITNDEAIEIQSNLFGFVNLLIEWDRKDKGV